MLHVWNCLSTAALCRLPPQAQPNTLRPASPAASTGTLMRMQPCRGPRACDTSVLPYAQPCRVPLLQLTCRVLPPHHMYLYRRRGDPRGGATALPGWLHEQAGHPELHRQEDLHRHAGGERCSLRLDVCASRQPAPEQPTAGCAAPLPRSRAPAFPSTVSHPFILPSILPIWSLCSPAATSPRPRSAAGAAACSTRMTTSSPPRSWRAGCPWVRPTQGRVVRQGSRAHGACRHSGDGRSRGTNGARAVPTPTAAHAAAPAPAASQCR